jgi:hypothetical protein
MLWAGFIRVLVLAGTLVLTGTPPAGSIAAATNEPAPAAPAPRRAPSALTLKERSGGKATDEQRVNDCKVPFALRGDHRRPAACAKR